MVLSCLQKPSDKEKKEQVQRHCVANNFYIVWFIVQYKLVTECFTLRNSLRLKRFLILYNISHFCSCFYFSNWQKSPSKFI